MQAYNELTQLNPDSQNGGSYGGNDGGGNLSSLTGGALYTMNRQRRLSEDGGTGPSWWTLFKHYWTPQRITLALSISGLLLSTAMERVSFKMSVDRLTPYRYLLGEVIIIVSFVVYACITTYKLRFTDKITRRMKEFPHFKLVIMAILDTISFFGLVVSAAGVTPTMTVILLHISTPFVVLGSRLNFPSRQYSQNQFQGVLLITIAVFISVIRHVMDIVTGVDETAAVCSLLYVSSAAAQGLGTVYKEMAIIEWSQPLDIHYMNMWLFFYQSIAGILFAPVIYMFSGVSDRWNGFPLHSLPRNIHDGWICFFGSEEVHSSQEYDTSDCECQYALLIIFLYVASNTVVLEFIDLVLQTSNQTLGRAMAGAVFVAFIALGIYDDKSEYRRDYDRVVGSIGIADIISIVVLLIGIDLNGRDDEPNITTIVGATAVEAATGSTAEQNTETGEKRVDTTFS